MAVTIPERNTHEWPPCLALVEVLAQSARGPKRQGAFALWLTLRTALDLCLEPALPERAHRRRIAPLERRISSLTLPPPLRRALAGAMADLKDPAPDTAARVLRQLVAPAGDTLGQGVKDIVREAVETAEQCAARRREGS